MIDPTTRAMPFDLVAFRPRWAVALLLLHLIAYAAGDGAPGVEAPFRSHSVSSGDQHEACPDVGAEQDRGQSMFQRGVQRVPQAEVEVAPPPGAPAAPAGRAE